MGRRGRITFVHGENSVIITKNKLLQIIKEEYSRILEGEVLSADFSKSGRSDPGDSESEPVDFKHKKMIKYMKGKRGEPGYFDQVIDFTKNIAAEWAKKYDNFLKILRDVRSREGKEQKVDKDEEGNTKIIPSSERAILSKEEADKMIAEHKKKMIEEMKAYCLEEKSKLDFLLMHDVRDTLQGFGTEVNFVKIPDLRKKSQDAFLETWYRVMKVRKPTSNFAEITLDYFHFFKDLATLSYMKMGRRKPRVFSGGENFVPGKRDPFLHPPKPNNTKPKFSIVKDTDES